MACWATRFVHACGSEAVPWRVQVNAASNTFLVFVFALVVVMAAELREFVQSVESAGKDDTFDEFVINGLAANHITVCVCVLRCCHVLG